MGSTSESLRFNPLSSWRSPRQLRQLATILVRNTAGARSDPFWSLSAVNLLFLVLTAVARSDKARRTLSTARDVLNRLGMEGKDGAESFSQPTSV